MELELHRIDLLQTSAAAPGTLVVLPPGENKTQKIAVGDLSGVVQCFSVKKGEVALTFKTLPCPNKVTALVLGKGVRQRDKIFVAAGNSVRGMTKKGKEFFRFTSALTEAISHMDVADSHIWAGCQYVHNHFIEGADKGLYMAPDKIMATELLPLTGASQWLPVIACRDCCIRILGTDGKPLFEVATGSPPTAVRYVPDTHGPTAAGRSNVRELLYGCQDGRLVQLLVDATAVRQGFVIHSQGSQDVRAAVTAIHCGADYSKTGCADIVLGREDGSLEVWDVDSQGRPQLVVSTQLPESITSVDGGYITSAASPDIVAHTFTGKVVAFASHPGAMVLAAAAEQRSLKTVTSMGKPPPQQDLVAAMNAKIAKETAELADLRAKVAKERERYAANQAAALAAAQSVVDMRHRLTLQAQDGCFVLFVEAAVSLFALALQSTVPLTLMDLPGNVAILSKSPADTAVGNATLATYRCQESTNRLSIKFTAREGTPGKICAYIIPALPPKTCSMIEVQLHPLCMHQMVSSVSDGGAGQHQQDGDGASLVQQLQQSRPCSELGLQGTFSVQDVHCWLRGILPDVPAHVPSGSNSVSHLFRECQLGSMLHCQYSAGQASFVCDSITTLAILHDSLLAAATAAKERVNMRYKLHPGALQHCCGLLWPQLEVQRGLARQKKLAGALQELQIQEGDTSFLAPEYKRMLSHKSSSRKATADDWPGDQQKAPSTNQQLVCSSSSSSSSGDEELTNAVEAFMQLFRDYSRLATGATVAVKQQLPGLEKLLRGDGPGCSLQATIDYIGSAGK